MRNTKRRRRWLALCLSLCLLTSMFPLTGMTYAAETGCTHVHDGNCGYIKEVEGKPCTFRHTPHDDTCGYAEEAAASPCSVEANHIHDEFCGGDPETGEGCNFKHEHDDTCGYAEAREAAPCSVEINHIHDKFCGYVEAAGAPCTHVHDANCGGLAQGSGSCTLAPGCTLPAGHEGECDVTSDKHFPSFLGATQTYDSGDVAIINDIIDNNNLGWEKDKPEKWPTSTAVRVIWTNDVNRRIKMLDMVQCGLTGTLNVTGLSSLEQLNCSGNNLDELDASNLSKLKKLNCSNNPNMQTLTVSGCGALENLDCFNNSLTGLDLTGLTSLEILACFNNKLAALDVSGLSNLVQFLCMDNPFQSLKLSDRKKLTVKVSQADGGTVVFEKGVSMHNPLGNNPITLTAAAETGYIFTGWTGDKSGSDNPLKFTISGDMTVTANFTKDTAAEYNPSDVKVINGIIEKNGLQWEKDKPENWPISDPGGEGLPYLTWDDSSTPKRIKELYLYKSGLSGTLDVTDLSELQTLNCNINGLTGLDVSNLSKLETLECSSNSLTSLDLTGLSGTLRLSCTNNPIQSLKLPNGDGLTVDVSPANSGTVSIQQPTRYFPDSKEVTLVAVPANGYVFKDWTGDASGSDDSLPLTLEGNKRITANFDLDPTDTTLEVTFDSNSNNDVSIKTNDMKPAVEKALGSRDKAKITSIRMVGSATEITGFNWRYLMELYKNDSEWTNLTDMNLSGMSGLIKVEDWILGGHDAIPNFRLATVHFPDSLQIIGEYAFTTCGNLKSLTLPKNLQVIKNNAFSYCVGLQSVTYPQSLQTIDRYAFFQCKSLRGAELSACTSLETIGDNAFGDCTGFLTVSFPACLKTLGAHAFRNSKLITADLSACTGLQAIENFAFSDCFMLYNVKFPESLKSIGENAFQSCYSLQSITFPAGLQTIKRRAFAACDLRNVFLPASVNTIGERAFYLCDKLEAYSVDPGNLNFASANGVLYDKSMETLINYPMGKSEAFFAIPSTVTAVDNYGFDSHGRIQNLIFPAGLQTIGDSAFYFCSSLTSMTFLGETPPNLGTAAFDNGFPVSGMLYRHDKAASAYASGTFGATALDGWERRNPYVLTVSGGIDETGIVFYPAGAQVQIKADAAPEGKTFDGWTTSNGGSFADAKSAGTTFTMPANDTTVTATFQNKKYTQRTLTDPSGVRVSGSFTDDAALEVKERTLHPAETCDVCDNIREKQDKGELIALYDVALKSGQYNGDLTVEIPVGEAYNGQTVILIHCRNKVMDSRTLTVSGGYAKGTFSSLSPFAVAKVPGKTVITGLPENCTLLVGQTVSWTPAPAGGNWSFDQDLLSMTKGGDTYTFKALKEGKATATYTVNGVPFTVTIAVNSSSIPQTGDTSNPWPWALLATAALLGGAGLLIYGKRSKKA